MKTRLAAWLFTFVLLVSCTLHARPAVPKNIILFIGDGMGLAHVTAGRTYKGWLELDRFTHIGLVLTHGPGRFYVTESAAGGTALSTGEKTFGGIVSTGDSVDAFTFLRRVRALPGPVGMNADTIAVPTVLEVARNRGMQTGVVVVCTITDATPAAFLAHAPSRRMHAEIARQISEFRATLLFGGGRQWFLPVAKGGRREDGRDLIHEMKNRGYAVLDSPESFFMQEKWGRSERVVGLFALDHMGFKQERSPSLTEMTRAALNFLSRGDEGFFLMIENEGIDDAGHRSLSDQIMVEVADLDDAVGEALRFAERFPETLIIVTADHETGGYTLTDGSLADRKVQGNFSTVDHTGTMVPLFAFGPGAEWFTGILENSDVGKRLKELIERK